MAAVNKTVFFKELLGWYLITLKLRETVSAGIPNSSRSGDQQPSNDIQIDINGDSGYPKEGHRWTELDFMNHITEGLELARKDDVPSNGGKLCIYKVPPHLRENNDKSYTPSIVSLGPYHEGLGRLQPMNRHKWRAFDQILKRTNHDAKFYIDSIKELAERARGCYEGDIDLLSDEFALMMVLDGSFVLELFRGADEWFTEPRDRDQLVVKMHGSMLSIQRDMIMLENQIPMFILDRLLGLQSSQLEHNESVAKQALQFLHSLIPTKHRIGFDQIGLNPSLDQPYLHCLDVFRQNLLRSGPRLEPRRWIKQWSHCLHVFWQSKLRGEPPLEPIRWIKLWLTGRTQLIHSVTELKNAGIHFKKRKTNLVWDIKFENGVLEIPWLFIDDGTKSLFLNLIAFEQLHLDCGNEITSYVIFMDKLINLPEDVGYLRRCGIFEHGLGSDSEVADLFNQLCQGVDFYSGNSYLAKLSVKVNSFYNNRWNSWRAILMRNYFSNPWTIISLIAAVILLILTFVQTFYGAYGYYRSP